MSVLDLDTRLWSLGCSAFWLDPDRWHGVPFGRDGRLEPFWLYLDKRPHRGKLRDLYEQAKEDGNRDLAASLVSASRDAELKPRYRIDDLGRLYHVAPKQKTPDARA